MSLTDQQKDLLHLLVAKHESTGGENFIFATSLSGSGLSYPGGDSAKVPYDDLDFDQLRGEGFIAAIAVSTNVLRGKPTERGIAFVREMDAPRAAAIAKQTNPSAEVMKSNSAAGNSQSSNRTTRKYEDECRLLGQEALGRLTSVGNQRTREVARQIELVARRLRERRGGIENEPDDPERSAAGIALRREMVSLRKESTDLAAALAADGVREFAEEILMSQSRLGVHAELLREYTALLANEIRTMLTGSEIFPIESVSPWQQDPVTQEAIRACEEMIAERRRVGDNWPYSTKEMNAGDLTWRPIVQEWEAFKEAGQIRPSPRERIPESFLRSILANVYGTTPKDVTWAQIQQAGGDLCRHYGRVLVLPLESEHEQEPSPPLESIAIAQFWKEREEEFRKHNIPENGMVATWFSIDREWVFLPPPGVKSPSRNAPQIFKSLAREAAKGLAGPRSTEGWADWLNTLRRATDPSTGLPLYSKRSSTGTKILPELGLDHMAKSGKPIPPGGIWEFVIPEDDAQESSAIPANSGAAEKRMYWEANDETIENLFGSAADFCLDLRSRTSHLEERAKTNNAINVVKPARAYRTALASNIDRLRKECGWSFDDLAIATGLEKKLIMGHVNKGKPARPRTLETYARVFSEKLGQAVTVADLEA